ncbi:anthrone oxygenase family protein [Acrocarpospora catenulata]|uniref:anthrone oxygenase family protein n=1 Tax=Acrocarpospora catenulata TaxID=2836182 RepID=UPI002023ABD5|nr:anthrone oxygenase family protein [Acrocarpospora catenulata]
MMVVTAVLAALTLVLTGWIAGLFYAYSVSVMIALDAIAPEHAVATMRSINIRIQNPAFFASFLGTLPAAILTGVLLLIDGQTTPGILFLAAAAAYLFGTFVPTVAVNIPLNNALDASTDPAPQTWTAFSPRWTRWNHLRTLGSTASLLLVGLAITTWATALS